MRDAAYGMLTDEDREVGHRLAGGWLAGAGEVDPIVLAECLERGGVRGQAARWYRRAAESAFEGNDHALVLAWTERALACAAGEPDLDARWHGEVHLLRASANRWRGQSREMQQCALRALAQLPRGSAPFYRAAEAVAHASCLVHDLEQLAAVSRDLLSPDLASGPEDPDSEETLAVAVAVSLARTAGHGFLFGQPAPARVLLRLAEATARALQGHPAVSAALQRAQAIEIYGTGDVSRTIELHASARESFLVAGDVRNACLEACNIGNDYLHLGAFAEAERALRSAMAEGDRLGLGGHRVMRDDLGLAVALQGRFAEGIAIEEEVIALARDGGTRDGELTARCYLARISLRAGDLDRAEQESRSLLEDSAALAGDRAYALAVLSATLTARGRPAEALAAAQRAVDILATEVDLARREGESLIRLAHAEALHESGDARRAAAAFTEARAALLARAAKITDPELRRSFLERVPENARILALAGELLGPPAATA